MCIEGAPFEGERVQGWTSTAWSFHGLGFALAYISKARRWGQRSSNDFSGKGNGHERLNRVFVNSRFADDFASKRQPDARPEHNAWYGKREAVVCLPNRRSHDS